MKLTKLMLIGTVAVCVVLAGCASDTPDSEAETDSFDGQWAIQQFLDGSGDLATPVEGSLPFIRVSGEELQGDTGCNSFFASVAIEPDGAWNSDGVGSTLMACSPELMAQEAAITAAIHDADSWSVDGNTAKLSSGSDPVLVATRLTVTLEGPRWSVTGINHGTGVHSIVDGTEPTLEFGSDGSLSATAGCNTMTATHEVTDQSLTIGMITQTEMACPEPEGLMEQETAMSKALGKVTTFEIVGYGLTLKDEAGNTLITARLTPDTP